MSLSRSEGKRKLPTLSLAKWLFLITGFVVFLAVCFVLYVRTADADYRNAENHAIRIAKEQGGLTEIGESVRHTWIETVWIVSGKDADGADWMIFERQDGLVREKIGENLSKSQMLAKFAEEHAGEPIRIIPGWFNDQPAWEIRYWNEKSEEHQTLDFYSFKDGSLLKRYVLSSQ